jgi:hypothetical protein
MPTKVDESLEGGGWPPFALPEMGFPRFAMSREPFSWWSIGARPLSR